MVAVLCTFVSSKYLFEQEKEWMNKGTFIALAQKQKTSKQLGKDLF